MNGQLARGHTQTPRCIYHHSTGERRAGVKQVKEKEHRSEERHRNKAGTGWEEVKRRGRREKEVPKWLLSCIKLVISVIRGKSRAESRSMWGMLTLCPPPLLSLPLSSFVLVQRSVLLFCATSPKNKIVIMKWSLACTVQRSVCSSCDVTTRQCFGWFRHFWQCQFEMNYYSTWQNKQNKTQTQTIKELKSASTLSNQPKEIFWLSRLPLLG